MDLSNQHADMSQSCLWPVNAPFTWTWSRAGERSVLVVPATESRTAVERAVVKLFVALSHFLNLFFIHAG